MTSNAEDTKNRMPLNPKIIMDDDTEEVTRKIAPAMIMPSRGPMPTVPMMGTSAFSTTIRASAATTKPRQQQQPQHQFLQQQQQQQQQQHTTGITNSNNNSNNNNNNTRSSTSWKLSSVPVLPEHHVLERTATFVPGAAKTPSEVASRIVGVLRERSIEARHENGKARARCTTLEGVDFRVRLYRGRGSYDHGIIVEVQRRFGTSLVFHHDVRAILDGAEGKARATTPPPPATQSGTSKLPEIVSDDDEHAAAGSVPSGGAGSSLAVVRKMFETKGFDSQYLALQMLSPLVDPERLSPATARAVATVLFEGDDRGVAENVVCYVTRENQVVRASTPRTRGLLDDDFDDDDDDRDSYNTLRNACLGIFANATRAYGKPIPKRLRDSVRPVLLGDLRDAENHPNTAFLSARCMEHLLAQEGGNLFESTEDFSAFRAAFEAGEAGHASLERQARKCISLVR
eukprot:CAMPEP_0201149590 /NCGR_PEP_ID=MMETSP0851-20130426/10858_1 /ASSEMBLY_ACC=CAM_ASM_000631 /TAXON_ID=183588 /ORGANISM="Pseudo-nitzschia fraudulenta, Strain WWA7" /LENGTH=457 /DNA_ID=CAMNT_0047426019 /DNA_START=189 /DNA_END=1562 /DNA_ORIENTATION=+